MPINQPGSGLRVALMSSGQCSQHKMASPQPLQGHTVLGADLQAGALSHFLAVPTRQGLERAKCSSPLACDPGQVIPPHLPWEQGWQQEQPITQEGCCPAGLGAPVTAVARHAQGSGGEHSLHQRGQWSRGVVGCQKHQPRHLSHQGCWGQASHHSWPQEESPWEEGKLQAPQRVSLLQNSRDRKGVRLGISDKPNKICWGLNPCLTTKPMCAPQVIYRSGTDTLKCNDSEQPSS